MKEKIIDLVFSEVFVILFTILTGISLYITLQISWTLFPLIIIFGFLAGFSCLGWRRLCELQQKKK
jgi:hypothetical protein